MFTFAALLLIGGASSEVSLLDASKAASVTIESPAQIQTLLAPVMFACALGDLRAEQPGTPLSDGGWTRSGADWTAPSSGLAATLNFRKPSGQNPAGCEFTSAEIDVTDAYAWLNTKLGDANDVPWNATSKTAIWNLSISGRRVAIFLSRDKAPDGSLAGTVIHILQ